MTTATKSEDAVKSRPILFSPPMIKAILEGRKTQTRRVARVITECWSPEFPCNSLDEIEHLPGAVAFHAQTKVDDTSTHVYKCPYGKPGDNLWVRESGWLPKTPTARELRDGADTWPGFVYDADGVSFSDVEDFKRWGWKRVPSIFMPRWASRIGLEILDVCVERLQDISESEARTEGLSCISKDGRRTWKYGIPDSDGLPGTDDFGWPWSEWDECPVAAFRYLWNRTNEKRGYSWDSNPWVWVITFKDRINQGANVA